MARIGDIDIHYELADYTPPWRATPAEAFLLYHGYARNMLFWQPWVPLLAADYRVLRFDARGCGETTKPPAGSRMSFAQLAGDAIGLMDVLGIERVHWVGESSGGIVGMTAALVFPGRIATLTLCDTPFKRAANIASSYTLGETDRAAAFDKYGVGGWCRKTLSSRLDTTKATPELCKWYIEQMDRIPKHIALAMDKAVAEGDLWPRLPDIKVPTLILSGTESPIAREADVKAMQHRMPAPKLVAFSGFGHGVNLLAPERCVSEVRTFLAEQRKAAAAAA
jgi:pimeloyl-ACP methyl ester carboxylesterase